MVFENIISVVEVVGKFHTFLLKYIFYLVIE